MLIVSRRWRHLVVFIAALIVEGAVTYALTLGIHRPRPLDVVTIVAPGKGSRCRRGRCRDSRSR